MAVATRGVGAGTFQRLGRPASGALLYIQLALLIVFTFLLGSAGVGAVRYGFIVGCVGVAYQAWRFGPARHLEMSIVLFTFAPFLRRVVDLSAGFEPSGYMLVGPMLGLLVPSPDLYAWLVTGRLRRSFSMLGPYAVMGLCLLYGLAVSLAKGELLPALLHLSKALPPMVYGLWMVARGGEQPSVVAGAARGCLIAMPLAGLYGLFQYFYLPDWDAYWMTMTSSISNSQGLAEAEKVRVFGLLNSAASYGHFLLAGILLMGFVQRGWLSLLLCLPMFAGLMLSSYRTAWVGLGLAVAYCWAHASTRGRAGMITVWGAAGIALILATTSFGDEVVARFSTLGSLSDDGSGQARAGQYSTIAENADKLLLGLGIGGLGPFGDLKPRVRLGPTDAADGLVVSSILLLGFVVGSFYILGVAGACGQGLFAVRQRPSKEFVAAGAIVLANAAVLPLTSVTDGEIGFLFWAFLGIISAAPAAPVSRPMPTMVAPHPLQRLS